MVYSVTFTFVGSHRSGEEIRPQDLVRALGKGLARFRAFGSGGHWESAGFFIVELRVDDFQVQPEPSEAFFEAVRTALIDFADVLTNVTLESLKQLRDSGYELEAVASVSMDQDQMELYLPWQLLREIGRLEVPLTVVSND